MKWWRHQNGVYCVKWHLYVLFNIFYVDLDYLTFCLLIYVEMHQIKSYGSYFMVNKHVAHPGFASEKMMTSSKWRLLCKYSIYYPRILFDLPCTPRKQFYGFKIVPWDPINAKKKMFPKNEPVWTKWKCIVSMATCNVIMVVYLHNQSYFSCYWW